MDNVRRDTAQRRNNNENEYKMVHGDGEIIAGGRPTKHYTRIAGVNRRKKR